MKSLQRVAVIVAVVREKQFAFFVNQDQFGGSATGIDAEEKFLIDDLTIYDVRFIDD